MAEGLDLCGLPGPAAQPALELLPWERAQQQCQPQQNLPPTPQSASFQPPPLCELPQSPFADKIRRERAEHDDYYRLIAHLKAVSLHRDALVEKNKRLEGTNAGLQADVVAKDKAYVVDMAAQRNKLEGQIQHLRSECDRKASELVQLRGQKDGLESEIQKLETDNDGLKKEVEQLKKQEVRPCIPGLL